MAHCILQFARLLRLPRAALWLLCLAALGALALVPPTHASTFLWEASSGLLPDQENPPWIPLDTASPEDPVLGVSELTLATDPDSEQMSYRQITPVLAVPDTWVIEARLRVLSSSNTGVAKRAADIFFTKTVIRSSMDSCSITGPQNS